MQLQISHILQEYKIYLTSTNKWDFFFMKQLNHKAIIMLLSFRFLWMPSIVATTDMFSVRSHFAILLWGAVNSTPQYEVGLMCMSYFEVSTKLLQWEKMPLTSTPAKVTVIWNMHCAVEIWFRSMQKAVAVLELVFLAPHLLSWYSSCNVVGIPECWPPLGRSRSHAHSTRPSRVPLHTRCWKSLDRLVILRPIQRWHQVWWYYTVALKLVLVTLSPEKGNDR